MADNKNMQDMLKQMSQQLNLSENELKSAAKKGNADPEGRGVRRSYPFVLCIMQCRRCGSGSPLRGL